MTKTSSTPRTPAKPADSIGSGGSGGLFNLQSLDFGLSDLGSTAPSPSLLVEGRRADSSVLSQTLDLGPLTSFAFTNWSGLQEVRFSANADFVLDNVSAVPEPASLALIALGIAGLALAQRKRVAVR